MPLSYLTFHAVRMENFPAEKSPAGGGVCGCELGIPEAHVLISQHLGTRLDAGPGGPDP